MRLTATPGPDSRVLPPAGSCSLVESFPGIGTGAVEHVGGKAHSLMLLRAAGFPVPPGVVLTSAFFDPWIESMLSARDWLALREAPATQRLALCDSLKSRAAMLPTSDDQRAALRVARDRLANLTDATLFAVRSSSPQEDLQGASFAGGYETRLGVRPDDFIDAIRACFASMFDERVIAYKAARGLGLDAPRMAVVIQQQIASETAGVAFSINPLNNDFDQAVIDACWGQGEIVVSGQTTPDHWVLDKVSGATIERVVSDKPLSRWLMADGQLVDRDGHRRSEACLSGEQLGQLLSLVKRIEAVFAQPVDIEWAIADDTVFILQARPVTACVPLPESMLTAPGERRRLYMDIALSSGLTINAPISPLGLAVFRRLFAAMARLAFGDVEWRRHAADALVEFVGGRMYLNLSNAMWLGGPRLLARKFAVHDAILSRTLGSIDARRYQSLQRPCWTGLRMLARVPGAWWRLRRMLGNSLLPFLAPERMHRRISARLQAYEAELGRDADVNLPLNEYWDRQVAARLQTLFDVSLASFPSGVLAVQAFTRIARGISGDDAELRSCLDRGFEGNVVVAISVEMHRLARLLQPSQLRDPEALQRQLASGALPAPFRDGWVDFMRRFGCRGPLEMDLAHPRYADQPAIALKQIAAMADIEPASDPATSAARQVTRRRAAVATVIARAGPIRRWILNRLNRIIELFAGLRDTPKQHLLMILHGLRRRIVLEGERLHRSGRLDAVQDVFDFDIDELVAAAADDGLDLRAIRDRRRPYYRQLAAQVVNFPALIDSRGRILRPPRGARRVGELQGVGLSPGVVSGRARVMRSPHEKPLASGEVLIAYTTDPGWTPIFANAAAIVLEIGGALQHGAVVARELGLPCVAGIEGVTTALVDGQLIEVDGSAGTVRLLTPVQT